MRPCTNIHWAVLRGLARLADIRRAVLRGLADTRQTRQTRQHSSKAISEKNVTRLNKFARVTRESREFGASGHSLDLDPIWFDFYYLFVCVRGTPFFLFLICGTEFWKLLYFWLLKGIQFDLYYLIFWFAAYIFHFLIVHWKLLDLIKANMISWLLWAHL